MSHVKDYQVEGGGGEGEEGGGVRRMVRGKGREGGREGKGQERGGRTSKSRNMWCIAHYYRSADQHLSITRCYC